MLSPPKEKGRRVEEIGDGPPGFRGRKRRGEGLNTEKANRVVGLGEEAGEEGQGRREEDGEEGARRVEGGDHELPEGLREARPVPAQERGVFIRTRNWGAITIGGHDRLS